LASDLAALRDHVFRGLLFESEAEAFARDGVELGADISRTEADLISEAVQDFPVWLKNESLQMSRLYCVLYCFENSVRGFVEERMQELHGPDWWNAKVPGKVKTHASSRRANSEKNSWLEGEKKNNLAFIDFGHLADIMISCWDSFQDLLPSQPWLKQRMDELEQARNFIAHNRMLMPEEFKRIYMYISDWIKQVGI
jgi:hypothetical protein